MKTIEIINEIQKMPILDRMIVIEKAIHSIRKSKDFNSQSNDAIQKGASLLLDYYRNDEELTSFTSLDSEEFF